MLQMGDLGKALGFALRDVQQAFIDTRISGRQTFLQGALPGCPMHTFGLPPGVSNRNIRLQSRRTTVGIDLTTGQATEFFPDFGHCGCAYAAWSPVDPTRFWMRAKLAADRGPEVIVATWDGHHEPAWHSVGPKTDEKDMAAAARPKYIYRIDLHGGHCTFISLTHHGNQPENAVEGRHLFHRLHPLNQPQCVCTRALTMTNNFLHLDLKGVIPRHDHFLNWLTFFRDCGFDGVVLEYEDRFPFDALPGTFRPGFSREQWAAIHAHCRELGLAVIPLVQTLGHLEWLLKHDAYAAWREHDLINEICPHNEAAVGGILSLVDEMIAVHRPFTDLIHIGADEAWNLASCPTCQAKAESLPGGRLQLYVEHVRRVCEHVISQGFRPLIWGDMFWREAHPELAALLPAETILVDWQYNGPGPFTSTADLLATGREVWGASGVASGGVTHDCVLSFGDRRTNIDGWHAQAGTVSGIIHTTWARSRSLLPPYGPWHAWLPCFIAAGRPGALADTPWPGLMEMVDTAMIDVKGTTLPSTLETLAATTMEHPLAQGCVDFWRLALRYRILKLQALQRAMANTQYQVTHDHIGFDPDYINHARRGRSAYLDMLAGWETDMQAFFGTWGLDSADEYVATRVEPLRQLFRADWAPDVPVQPPRSRR